jgi:hypothetical protein
LTGALTEDGRHVKQRQSKGDVHAP